MSPCPSDFYCFAPEASTERLWEEFPAYGSVLLRLADPNLRTVIVTAAVYWGFSRELRLAEAKLTPFLNLPAPGTRQTLYVSLRFSRVLCFW